MKRWFFISFAVLILGGMMFSHRPEPAPVAAPVVQVSEPEVAKSLAPKLPIQRSATQPKAAPHPKTASATSPPGNGLENKAHELLRDGKVNEAIEVLKELLVSDPKSEFALVELGILLGQNPRHRREAEAMLRRALEVNTENFIALDELLSLSLDPQNTDRANRVIADYHRAYPDSPNINAAYGRSLASQGDVDGAIEYLQRASRGNPEIAEGVYVTLAELYRRRGDGAGAAEAYGRVIGLQQESLEQLRRQGYPTEDLERNIVSNQVNLADALLANRKFEEAERLLRSLAERNPNNQAVARLLSRLQSGG